MPTRYAYINRLKDGGYGVYVYETSGSMFVLDTVVFSDVFVTKKEAIDFCKEREYPIMNLGVSE